MKKSRLLVAICGLLILNSAFTPTNNVYALTTPVFSIVNPSFGIDSFQSNTFGYEFTAIQNRLAVLQVHAVGIYDGLGSTAGNSTNYEVGIWNSSGSLLDSVSLSSISGGFVLDGYRWMGLSKLIFLNRGESVRVGVLVGAGQQVLNNGSITPGSWFSNFLATLGDTNLFTQGETLTFPNTNALGREYMSANLLIESVPLPPAIWLFCSGLLGLIGIARRKKAA